MARTWSSLFAGLALAALVSAPAGAQDKPAVLDLNTATREQLVAYPGIGAQYADKIIAGRPFKQRSELVSRKIMPSDVYLSIKTNLRPTVADKNMEDELAKNVPPPPMFDDRGRMNINVASREQLLAIPGIGQRFVDEFINKRPFKDMNDVIKRANMPADMAKVVAEKAFVQ
jgi:DNA uptake protein ComE-like DNA-binding protein